MRMDKLSYIILKLIFPILILFTIIIIAHESKASSLPILVENETQWSQIFLLFKNTNIGYLLITILITMKFFKNLILKETFYYLTGTGRWILASIISILSTTFCLTIAYPEMGWQMISIASIFLAALDAYLYDFSRSIGKQGKSIQYRVINS